MAEEGAHVLELSLDRGAQVCRRQERPDFANKCCRRGAVADPRPNLDGVEKGLGQALDKGAYIQRALTIEPLGALHQRQLDASLVFREQGQG